MSEPFEGDDLVLIFYMIDYNHKKSNVILAIGFRKIVVVTQLIEFIIKKLKFFFKCGYSIDGMEVISLLEFKKRFTRYFKKDKK